MKRAIFIGLIAVTPLGACGSDGTEAGGRNSPGAIGSYQGPPANPQEALLNPERPLPNTSAPLPSEQEPLPNPEQPQPPPGSGAGLQNTCSSICTGTGICSGACQERCTALGMVIGQCTAPVAAFIQCARNIGLGLVCSGDGELRIPDGTACLDEARAASNCLGLNAQPSDNSGPGNDNNRGRGRLNDAGLPVP